MASKKMKKTIIMLSMLALVLASCSKADRNERKYLDGIMSDNYEESAQAMTEFTEWVKADKSTMTHDFNLMREKMGMKIVDSPDGKVRCYSWVTERGDTTTSYANIVQWLMGDKLVAFSGPIDALLTGRKPSVAHQWSLPHSIDTIYQIEGGSEPIYLIEESYVNEKGMSFSYISAAVNRGLALKILPFFFNGIETAGNREYVDDGKVNKRELIKWDAKGRKLQSYLTDENNHVIPGKYETYVLGKTQFTKLGDNNDNNTNPINN